MCQLYTIGFQATEAFSTNKMSSNKSCRGSPLQLLLEENNLFFLIASGLIFGDKQGLTTS